MAAAWQNVRGLTDGEDVCAATFNRPLAELASRTEYLKRRLDAVFGDGKHTSVRIDAALSDTDTPDVGDVVCIDPETKRFRKAIASMSLYDAFAASDKAFAIGMLVSRTNLTGIVTLFGKVDMSGWDMDAMVDGGVFASGQYYLSAVNPGKITQTPTGPRIIIGWFSRQEQVSGDYSGAYALLNPQYADIEAHSHRTYVLVPRPCGDSYLVGDKVVVGGYKLPVESDYSNDIIVLAPRLVIEGEWTASFNEKYFITIEALDGGTPTNWPCRVKWVSENGKQSGSQVLSFFGESMPVGDHGMHVRLAPDPELDENTIFQVTGTVLSDEDRTWTVDRNSGRGWTDADANTLAELPNGTVRFSGVSNKPSNSLVYKVPAKVFDLTALELPQDYDTLVIDGVEYTFTHNLDGEDEHTIHTMSSVYETMLKVSESCDSCFYDEQLRQVLVGAETVTYKGAAVSPLAIGEIVAFVAYASGESLSTGYRIGQTTYSVVPATAMEPQPLSNGMTCTLIGTAAAGDSVSATVHCVPGAVFRYNIGFDQDLNSHFPPVPAKSGSFMLNGVEVPSYEFYPEAVVAIGADSLYWRDNLSGRQPWPVPEMSRTDRLDPEDEYQEMFHFVTRFHSESGLVTSLRPAEGSPIVIRRCGTDENATTGDLEMDIDFTVDTSDQNMAGYSVPKASRNGRLLFGPVVEKLIAGPGISFAKKAGMPEGQGTVTISADGAAYAGDFEAVALENAKIESIGMFPYTRLLKWDPDSNNNIPTGFVAKFHVPATLANATYRVKFYATVFGEESYEGSVLRYAGVTLDYAILPDYTPASGMVYEASNLKTGVITPDAPLNLAIPLGVAADNGSGYNYTAFDPILIHNDTDISPVEGNNALVINHAIPTKAECDGYVQRNNVGVEFGVKPGYTVALRFSRSSPVFGAKEGSPYTGNIGFLNLRWAIEEVTEVDKGNTINTEVVITDTVMKLRDVAARSGSMDTVDQIVRVLSGVISALK